MVRHLFAILLTSTTLSCSNLHNKVVPVEMILNELAFECNLKGERGEIIDPYEIFWSVTVRNNGDKPLMFGAYDLEYDQKNRKYGYFEFITDQDTIKMFTRYYPDVIKINPGDSFEFRMSNFGLKSRAESRTIIDSLNNMELLFDIDKLSAMVIPSEPDPSGEFQSSNSNVSDRKGFCTIKDSLHVERLIEKLKRCKVRYIPLELEQEEGTYAINDIQNVRIDSLTVSYTSEGQSQLLIDKIGNIWTYEIW